jgi:hypothetical protein
MKRASVYTLVLLLQALALRVTLNRRRGHRADAASVHAAQNDASGGHGARHSEHALSEFAVPHNTAPPF